MCPESAGSFLNTRFLGGSSDPFLCQIRFLVPVGLSDSLGYHRSDRDLANIAWNRVSPYHSSNSSIFHSLKCSFSQDWMSTERENPLSSFLPAGPCCLSDRSTSAAAV